MAAVLSVDDRRRAPRVRAARLGLVETALLRPGLPVALVAVSRVGALVASPSSVRPGARTDLSLEAVAGPRWMVGVLVVRCWVSALDPLRYCAALEFDRPVPEGMGSSYPKNA